MKRHLPRFTVAAAVSLPLALHGQDALKSLGSPSLGSVEGTLDETVVQSSSTGGEIFPDNIVAKRSEAGTKTDTPILLTPQSISAVSRAEIEMRGARNVNEALAYSSGIIAEATGRDSRVDDVVIRGFSADTVTNNNYLDGLRLVTGDMWTTPSLDVFGMERVEVLKGPSAVLYGQVAPGGLVNRVSKRPTDHSRGMIGFSYDNLETSRAMFDFSGPVAGSDAVSYRIVGLYQDGGTEVDYTDLERMYLAPSVTFHLGSETDLTLYAIWQQDHGGATFQFLPATGTLYPTQYGVIERETFLGEPDFNTFDRTQVMVGYEFDHRFNEVWSMTHNLRYSHIDTFYESVVGGRTGLLADNRTYTRRAVDGDGNAQNLTIDTRFRAEFSTGPVEHDVLLGFDYIHREREHLRRGARAAVPNIDIFNPVYGGTSSWIGSMTAQLANDATGDQYGFYAQDQLVLGNWHLLLGGRYDLSEDDNLNTITSARSITDPEKFTGRAGLLYHFDSGVAPYLSYATSFEPLSGTDRLGSPFDPTTGEQFEIGVKYEPEGFDGLFTVALFDLTQENVLTRDAVDPLFQSQTGEVNIRGVEVEGRATVCEGLDFIGNMTFLDSEVTKDNSGNLGNRVPTTPKFTASAWIDYTFQDGNPLQGLGIGAGVRHVGERYGDAANAFDIPSYTVFDAAIRYDLGKLSSSLEGTRVALNVSNLTDELYVATASHPISSHYGSGRIATLSLSHDW